MFLKAGGGHFVHLVWDDAIARFLLHRLVVSTLSKTFTRWPSIERARWDHQAFSALTSNSTRSHVLHETRSQV